MQPSKYEQPRPDSPGYRLGEMENGKELIFYGDESILTIAPSGSGKTQCFVIPNLLTWPGAAFVLDVKGELYEKTAGYRAANVGPVYKFDVFDEKTAHFNPFAFMSSKPEQLWDDSEFITEMMLPANENQNSNQEFWVNSARNLLQACIIAMAHEADEEGDPRNPHQPSPRKDFTTLITMVSNDDGIEQALEILQNTDIPQYKLLYFQINDNLFQPSKTGSHVLASVRQQLTSQIQALISPRVERATRKSSWTPQGLRDKNATVYVVLRSGQVKQYVSLLRLILGIHIRQYLAETPDPKAKNRTLFMLDEMPQLEAMSPIINALDLGRQYGVQLACFAQNMNQLVERYGRADAFLTNCAVQVFMNLSATDQQTTQMISTALGTREELTSGRDKPLADISDLSGPKFANKAIVISQGENPAKVTRKPAWNDSRYKDLMDLPPPR